MNRSNKALYNFTALASLFADKPMRGTLFYDHLNPTQSLSPGEVSQQSDKYGLTFSLLAPLTPVPVYFEANRTHDKGSSVERVVDNRIDRLSLKLDRALWNVGTTHFGYNAQKQVSASGSSKLPIQSSHQIRTASARRHPSQVGERAAIRSNNNIAYSTQKYTLAGTKGKTPKLDDFRFLLNYRGVHSSKWQSFANYFFSDNRQDERATQVNSAIVGATWTASKNSGLSASLRNINTRAPQSGSHTRHRWLGALRTCAAIGNWAK
ncbi:MAG: hypothetical protein IPP88_24400 [Betaproteobacteria bacterium]|nr:hypothetical protein [Betaproteobacteria bacterium]